MSLTHADNQKLVELQTLCDECKDAINAQSPGALKNAMQDACEKCKSVRELVPELMELRQKTENFARTVKSA
jgi:hypothetical protein